MTWHDIVDSYNNQSNFPSLVYLYVLYICVFFSTHKVPNPNTAVCAYLATLHKHQSYFQIHVKLDSMEYESF